ncbi:MAG: dimethyl sulfoxide reductase anchor subunit [Firmicutes bacterium]|jgi:DMSO reductase anchor subunit|uniref:DMSO reductase n=1 Tax=Sulfobacillus benefaciens TaxID=453960 RepID=A0A2T2X9C1_9FIRM|nr:dimethyl sulfoxide reductase anchor subunit [Bacillota bacterium]MCL5013079.1 dimethyl sulfoxide reductase anchor subunit [Bacillota bacterium]PSR31085.1 MAG: DMSO reductase [Sulfobacillus benefaciens]
MKPTWPLLALTLLQGLSVGLMSVAAVLMFTHPVDSSLVFACQLTAFTAGAIGGIASIFHMHRLSAGKYVMRRLKTSWLSREALSTGVYTMVVGMSVLSRLFMVSPKGVWVTLSVLAALLGIVAVYITAMLYATIRAMRSWHSPLTVLMFFGASALSGTSWGWGIATVMHRSVPGLALTFGVVLAIAAVFKILQVRNFREAENLVMSTTGTGLSQKPYRVMDTGTTRAPYRYQTQIWPALTRSQRIGGYGLMAVLMWLVPVIALTVWNDPVSHLIAAVTESLGLIVERWMFFGDATHSSRVWFTDEPKRSSQVVF